MNGPDTRASLLLRIRDPGQHDAWREFIAIYEPLVYRLARQRGMQDADARDLVQDVFTLVGKAIHRFDPFSSRGTFRGWLFRVARNLTINTLTRQKNVRGSGDSEILRMLGEVPDDSSEATRQFDLEYRRELFQLAANAVRSEFREDTFQAFWMSSVLGKPLDEVAREVSKSNGAVRIARSRVLNRLKEEVKRLQADDAGDA